MQIQVPMSYPSFDSRKYFIWILAPHVETDDANIAYYYDFSQSIKEYTTAFAELNIQWKWCPVTLRNFRSVIDDILSQSSDLTNIFFNLCDGDEINGSPGISVIQYLDEKGVIYTGSDEHFYDITTSKIPMKEAFDKANVSNAPWFSIISPQFSLNGEFHALPKPIIIKPAVSAGSIGLGVRNVVHNETELMDLVADLYKGYHGWDLSAGGFVAESFIKGEEYTTFIIGSHLYPGSAHIYPPVERRFNNALSEEEKFLSFDRLWEFYEGEKPINDYEDFYNYYPVDESLSKEINDLSWAAFRSVGGTGYARIDIRRDKETGKLYILEVNSQCGLSEDENHTSIGAILRFAKESYAQMCLRILNEALQHPCHAIK